MIRFVTQIIVMIGWCLSISAHALELGHSHLGPLPLNKKTKVSLASLQSMFPNYTVTYVFGEGDAGVFHYFDVTDKEERLFTIQSEASEALKNDDASVGILLLEIHSPAIKDPYGVSVGMHYRDVLLLRGEPLTIGLNHHDHHVGAGSIWYSLVVNEQAGADYSLVSQDELLQSNPKVLSISWPTPRW